MLRDDALKAHPAGVLEHVDAVRMLQMLVQPQAGSRTSQQARERGFSASLEARGAGHRR